ncbi:dynamin-related protein 3A isoform X2 [Brachypodium distachyon]|uniref:dynamin-related protein 3A isoform X2 n=1 Tax=Brachypodium distachyon TaxID=15368 RepID=UPI000D0D9EAE|nr:dynamin-related protein 3A isoform X2 [Brachypodium distachyon]|eukprot:XP_024311649.1 dynamin-related protein 3A isoform X2 [Brachypodium distachyon]
MADSATAAAAPPATVGQAVIPLVNRLQDIMARLDGDAAAGVELPQVAAIGGQSSGKSSVLEALVGRDFLPRGPDICTRRPLVLQLVRHSAPEEWGEFLHAPGRRFHDFEHIKREIQSETDKEAGGNKGVSEKQIRLKIFSPNVIDITLVDLPGITRVPVGDQPTDIESRIRTMIMQYIKHRSCIILAVSPANADLANSDALQLARLGDPDGSRTIGVITKLDIMDRGTDARNFLLGNVIPLKLGYVGVVNRSQEDINFNRSIKDALAFEEKFFSTLPAYHGLSQCCGVPQLAKKLNMILLKHITDMLPGLKSRINAQLVAVAKEHAAYGDTAESTAGQGVKLLNILGKYCEAFSSMVEGKNKVSTDQLSGGARIHYIFQSIFVKSLEEIDPCKNISDEDIRTSIQNSGGPKGAMFLPEVPFEILVRRQIGRLLDPSLQCAKFIYDELVKISHGCLTSELQKYPILKRRMGESVSNFLRDGLRPAETMITHIIEMEMDYINTSHSSFVGGSTVVELAKREVQTSRVPTPLSVHKDGIGLSSEIQLKSSVENNMQLKSERCQKSRAVFARDATGTTPEQPDTDAGTSVVGGSQKGHSMVGGSLSSMSDPRVHSLNSLYSMVRLREVNLLSQPPITLKPSENKSNQDLTEIAIVKLLVKSYYDIVRKSIEDAVPKAIMHFLVNHTKRELHNILIRKLYRENLLDEMLRETDEVLIRRQRIQETLQVLEQAHRTLEEFPLEAEKVDKGYSLSEYTTGLPKIPGLNNRSPGSIYTSSSSS